MKNRKNSWVSWVIFKVVRSLARLMCGKCDIVGIENLPKKNAIIVANHAQMYGPVTGEIFMPDNCYIWCAGEMMNFREVPKYAYKDFWSRKPKWQQPFYKILSYIIAPIAHCAFNNARTVAVYHDSRVLSTFRESVKMLSEGKNMLIFPEKDEENNNIVFKFQEKFVDVAKLYYKKTGEELIFVPMYNAPSLKRAYIGKEITFDKDNDIALERSRIIKYLEDEITNIARTLPLHTVVPYRNISKKYYLTNKDTTEVPHEKTYR